MVYSSSGVLNFAQGAFAFVGAYVFFYLSQMLGLPFLAAFAVAIVATFLLGRAINWLLVRPVIGQSPVVVVMMTIGLSSALEAVVLLIFGPSQRFLVEPFGRSTVRIPGGVVMTWFDLIVVIFIAVTLGTLALLLKYTRAGLSIRAVSDSALLAGYWRTNSSRVVGLTWGIAFALSTVAGVAYALRTTLDTSALSLGALVFPAIIIGGMDSLVGAIVGALLLGIGSEAITLYIGGQWSDFTIYATALAVLVIRPYGLFGKREVVRL